jgi:hypothetical protein
MNENEARQVATAVRDRMLHPERWTIVVQPRITGPHWRWCLTCNNVTLVPAPLGRGAFRAQVCEDPRVAGNEFPGWAVPGTFDDPQDAVDAVVDGAMDYLLKMTTAVVSAEYASREEKICNSLRSARETGSRCSIRSGARGQAPQ